MKCHLIGTGKLWRCYFYVDNQSYWHRQALRAAHWVNIPNSGSSKSKPEDKVKISILTNHIVQSDLNILVNREYGLVQHEEQYQTVTEEHQLYCSYSGWRAEQWAETIQLQTSIHESNEELYIPVISQKPKMSNDVEKMIFLSLINGWSWNQKVGTGL